MCYINWVTIKRFAALSGYTTGAIEKKIERKQWAQNIEWIYAPDGRIQISISAVETWYSRGVYSAEKHNTKK